MGACGNYLRPVSGCYLCFVQNRTIHGLTGLLSVGTNIQNTFVTVYRCYSVFHNGLTGSRFSLSSAVIRLLLRLFFGCLPVLLTLEEVEEYLVNDTPRHQKGEHVPEERREEPLERVRRSLIFVPASPYVAEYSLEGLFHPAKCRRVSVPCRAVFSVSNRVSPFRGVHIPQKGESAGEGLILSRRGPHSGHCSATVQKTSLLIVPLLGLPFVLW